MNDNVRTENSTLMPASPFDMQNEFNGNTQSNAVKLGHPFFHQNNNKKCEKSGRTLAAYPNFKIFMKPWYPVACGGS